MRITAGTGPKPLISSRLTGDSSSPPNSRQGQRSSSGIEGWMVAVGGSGRSYSGHSGHHHRFLEHHLTTSSPPTAATYLPNLPRSRPPAARGPSTPRNLPPPKHSRRVPKPKRSRTIPARFDLEEAPTCICHQPGSTPYLTNSTRRGSLSFLRIHLFSSSSPSPLPRACCSSLVALWTRVGLLCPKRLQPAALLAQSRAPRSRPLHKWKQAPGLCPPLKLWLLATISHVALILFFSRCLPSVTDCSTPHSTIRGDRDAAIRQDGFQQQPLVPQLWEQQ